MKTYKILIIDLVGMLPDENGQPDHQAVKDHIINKGGVFHCKPCYPDEPLQPGKLHFFYHPQLTTEQDILAVAAQGHYDALIAAATYIPEQAKFAYGGVRIGAGTGNMGSASWGGGAGIGGNAPLMNTPGFNSRATAQMVMKSLFRVMPDIDVEQMHQRVVSKDFDTGKDLVSYPTSKLEGKRIAVLGYGNIGREVARLAKSFAMEVVIYARQRHQDWIESEGFIYADSVVAAAFQADVISPHLGLGVNNSNMGIIDKSVLSACKPGAVLINFDRGELVDVAALDWALGCGQIRHGAIDADIFKDPQSEKVFGPLAPYLDVYDKHPDKLLLLPHAAADTEHHSRVAGAKQAVDQIFEAIINRQVINLVGQLPQGFVYAGAQTVKGIGKVTDKDIADVSAQQAAHLAKLAAAVAGFWQGDNQDAKGATKAANELFHLMEQHGLLGPM